MTTKSSLLINGLDTLDLTKHPNAPLSIEHPTVIKANDQINDPYWDILTTINGSHYYTNVMLLIDDELIEELF